MDDAVGDQDRRADAIGGHIAQSRLQRRKQPRAAIIRIRLAGLDEARLDIIKRAEALFQFGAHVGGLRGAIADRLAARLIDDDRDHIFQRPAVLARQRRIEQSQQQHREGYEAQKGAAPARERDQARGGQRGDGQHNQR